MSNIKNYLIGDSRVKNLYSTETNPFTKIVCKPGATYYSLMDAIDEHLTVNYRPSHRRHTYILAGICSITTRVVNRRQQYEETSLNMEENIVDNTICAIDDLQRAMLREDLTPIFCTILPLHFMEWNATRLNQGKTLFLSHAEQYEDMQEALQHILVEINSKIAEIYRNLNMATPSIHRTLQHNRGHGRLLSYKYNQLVDGCHPSVALRQKMAITLWRTIEINRNGFSRRFHTI